MGGKIPNPPHFTSTVDMIEQRGLRPFLEFEDGTPRYIPEPGSPNDTAVPAECMVEWPDEEAEAGLPLSWDLANRTKEGLVRDYSFVKRSALVDHDLNHVWNFHRLSHGDVIRTEGATLVAFHTPGHSSEHCSFWFQERKSLF